MPRANHNGDAVRSNRAGDRDVAESLAQLGDKVAARALGARCGVSVVNGSSEPIDAATAKALVAESGGGGMIIKTLAGDGRLYVEAFMADARRVEAHCIGDNAGAITNM